MIFDSIEIKDIVEIIQGPDFPTGGIILGKHAHAHLGKGRVLERLQCTLFQLIALVGPGIAGRADRNVRRPVRITKVVCVAY